MESNEESPKFYKPGDYVYCEGSSPNISYRIVRIDNFHNPVTGSSQVTSAEVQPFYRWKELPSYTKLQMGGGVMDIPFRDKPVKCLDNEYQELEKLDDHQISLLSHRQVFPGFKTEEVQVSRLRGKCSVYPLLDTDSLETYLLQEDIFFYTFQFQEDKYVLMRPTVRVGKNHQAEIPPLLKESKYPNMDTLIWNCNNGLDIKQIEQFQKTTQAVTTYARAIKVNPIETPLEFSRVVADSSRDTVKFQALELLHGIQYDMGHVLDALIPTKNLLTLGDQLSEWTPETCKLFEEGFDKYKKNIVDVHEQVLPWKRMKEVVEYYWLWKTTDCFVKRKQEQGSKFTEDVPFNEEPPLAKHNGMSSSSTDKPCESCGTSMAFKWYTVRMARTCTLCHDCWFYWKRYDGLKMIDSPLKKGVPLTMDQFVKSRRVYLLKPIPPNRILVPVSSFFMRADTLAPVARKLCCDGKLYRKIARKPHIKLDIRHLIRSFKVRYSGLTPEDLEEIEARISFQKSRKPLLKIIRDLGQTHTHLPNWYDCGNHEVKQSRIVIPYLQQSPSESDEDILIIDVSNEDKLPFDHLIQ